MLKKVVVDLFKVGDLIEVDLEVDSQFSLKYDFREY